VFSNLHQSTITKFLNFIDLHQRYAVVLIEIHYAFLYSRHCVWYLVFNFFKAKLGLGSLEDISRSKRLKTQVFYTLRKKNIKEDNTKYKNQAKYAALLRNIKDPRIKEAKYAALLKEVRHTFALAQPIN
ncbi:hypothetical protein Tco_1451873, partial [Tanacetum coccineum]